MNGDTPGDGKTSPFGPSNGAPMTPTNLLQNPSGPAPSRPGINFLERPSGSGPAAAAPPDFSKGGRGSAPPGQKNGKPDDINPASEIPDGGGLVPLADVPANSPRKAFIGVGSIGDSSKPFRLKGG